MHQLNTSNASYYNKKDSSIMNYDQIISQLSLQSIEDKTVQLKELLPGLWCEEYRKMTPTETNILQFTNLGFEFLFDLSAELVASGAVAEDQAVEDRVVGVFGKSTTQSEKRDSNRMKGFLGPSTKVFGEGYDKGHFIGHSLGGGLDVNLFPQKRDINRGWSERGKVFRAMEKYCADNPGTFCFSRPIYHDLSWRPCKLQYGVLTQDNNLWVEMFEN